MALTTVTVLFTDVVGSTELMSRVGEAAADELRREHFDRLRRVIGSTGGREVKNLGDGLMVVFDAAASALTCATGMQQAMASTPIGTERERIEIRVGVASGEADTEDGDYFGVPVVEAARLCAVAGAGEVLVSELTRLLVRSRGGFDLEPVGALELKRSGPINSALHAWALAMSGHPGEAAALGAAPDVWRNSSSLVVAVRTLRAEAAARCGDEQACRTLIGLLAPCRNQIATTLQSPIYAVAHATGIARACVGDLDGAIADLEHAIAIHERWRAPFHTAYSRTALASVLTQRAAAGDLDCARALANAAANLARERDYGYILRDATAVLQRLN